MTRNEETTPAARTPDDRRAVLPPPPPDSTDKARGQIDPGAVLAWSVLQVAALTVGLLQVPLAAKSPPGTSLALDILIAGQVGGAALLAPLLFRTPATALVVLASAWPALLLAGGLGAGPVGGPARGGLAVSAWIVTLYLWSSSFRAEAPRQAVTAAAALLAIGGALLGYLAAEFSPAAGPENALPGSLRATPLLLAWDFGHDASNVWGNAIPLGILLLAGSCLRLAGRRWAHRSSASQG